MRLILFVSVLGILVSLAVLIAVIIKAKRAKQPPPEGKQQRGRVIDVTPKH